MKTSGTRHYQRLTQSTHQWNAWRSEHPDLPIDLSDLDLSTLDLFEANLRAADLSRSALIGALLLGADLRHATLHRTDLRGADLRAAQLAGADLAQSVFLTQTQIEAAHGDSTTRLPPLLDTPAHWT